MRTKRTVLFCLLAAMMMLAGFLFPDGAMAAGLLTDQTEEGAKPRTVTLYFRHSQSRWLEREQREISISLSESPEKALVQALVEGPKAGTLTSLFPAGVKVLSVIAEGRQLFVTFNERLMAPYSDEGADIAQEGYRAGEGRLRRELAMASLVNTLTENGEYARVQVLVRGETTLTGSLRLSKRYYLEDSDALPDPLTRQEGHILLPSYLVDQVMARWQNREWDALKASLAQVPVEASAQNAFGLMLDASPAIQHYTLTPGMPGPDGRYAVVCVSLQYQAQNGGDRMINNWPLRLVRQEGSWALPWGAFGALLEACR